MKPDHRVHGIVEGKEWAPGGTSLAHLDLILRVDELLPSHPRLCKNEVVYQGPDRGSAQSFPGACHQVF